MVRNQQHSLNKWFRFVGEVDFGGGRMLQQMMDILPYASPRYSSLNFKLDAFNCTVCNLLARALLLMYFILGYLFVDL